MSHRYSAASRTVGICSICGAARALGEACCAGAAHREVTRDGPYLWSRVHIHFSCGQCGRTSAVADIADDLSFGCLFCEARSSFVAEDLQDFMQMACGAAIDGGDLCFEGDIEVDVVDGVPLCAGCGEPWSFGFEGELLVASCGGCQLRRRYDFPKALLNVEPSLRGMIAAPRNVDPFTAKHFDSGNVRVATCPRCGAPLHPDPETNSVVCQYCQASVQLCAAGMAKGPRSQPLWFVFESPPRRL